MSSIVETFLHETIKGIFALTHWQQLHFFWGKVCSQPQPCCADVTAAQIWKSLHIVAAIAVAVLTQEREISTCPHHIPALALNSTHLPSELQSKRLSTAAKACSHSARIFSNALNVKSWRQVTVERLHYPDQMWNSVSIPGISNVSLLTHLTEKLQKVTHRREVGGEEGAEPALWLYSTTRRRGGKVLSQNLCIRLTSFKLIPHAQTDENWSTSASQTTTSLCRKQCHKMPQNPVYRPFTDFQIVQEKLSVQLFCIVASPLNQNTDTTV